MTKKLLSVAVATIAAAAVLTGCSSEAERSQVGDCLRNEGTMASPDLKKTDCTADDAEYKVVDKIEGDISDGACENAEGAHTQYYEEYGGKKFSLCLGDV